MKGKGVLRIYQNLAWYKVEICVFLAGYGADDWSMFSCWIHSITIDSYLHFQILIIQSNLLLRFVHLLGLTLTLTLTVFCDNEAVYKNVTFAESCLKKKHNSICFHRVRQCVAAGILAVHKVDTKFNLSDILTKSLPGPLRKFVRERIMFIPN